MALLQSKISNVYQELLYRKQEFEFKKPLLKFLNQSQQERNNIQHLQSQLDQLLALLHQDLKAASLAHHHEEILDEEIQRELDHKLEEIKIFYQQLSETYEAKQTEFQAQLKQEQFNGSNAEVCDSEVEIKTSTAEIPKDAPMTADQIKAFVQALDKYIPCQLSFELTEHGLQNTLLVVREMLSCKWLKENICLNPCKDLCAKLNEKCRAYIHELSCMLSPNEDFQSQKNVFLFDERSKSQGSLPLLFNNQPRQLQALPVAIS